MYCSTTGTTTPRDRRNLRYYILSCVAWAACLVAVSRILRLELIPSGTMAWLVATLPAIASLLVVAYFVRYLRGTDELQRAIQLNALAISFGASVFSMIAYDVLELAGAPTIEANTWAALGLLLYSSAVAIGNWRYR